MESTTVKVSKETVRQLAALQQGAHRTLEETIHLLLKRHRKELDEAFEPTRRVCFGEGDRGEDRSDSTPG
jgi:hypothetical protein